ncbi:heme oxygenase-like, multi-helical [Trema orientale]|uniref:Heme oxygenase-like, multi-helical n=1 Tax=Trema orientale TaxID=63057 RepID=A0A2P5C0S1_TREOI|nr:heme oxygenase-like, multi-helical [Trema orientale]
MFEPDSGYLGLGLNLNQAFFGLTHRILDFRALLHPAKNSAIALTINVSSGRVEGKQVPSNSTQVAAYTNAAIAPVMRLYAYISDIILTYLQRDATKELYRKWLEYYRSEEIERTVVPLFSLQDPNMIQLTIFSNFNLTNHSATNCIRGIHIFPAVNEFDVISKQYCEEYEQWMESITSSVSGQEYEFDYDRMKNALEKFVEFEKKTHAKLEEEFFKRIVKNKNPSVDVHVISYCSSDDLIFYDENSVTTGEIVKKLESLFDKYRAFLKVLEGHETDIGIVFRSSKLEEHLGSLICPTAHGLLDKPRGGDWKPQPGRLYMVNS